MPTNPTDPILAHLLENIPSGWRVSQLYLGQTFTASFIENASGERRIGLAALPGGLPTKNDFLQPGFNRPEISAAELFSRYALGVEGLNVSAGLATLNALVQPDSALLCDIDAGDWLVEKGRGHGVALVGRFPLIDELEPIVRKLWVFELNPRPGEYEFSQAPEIIPQADILAITGSSLLNHSLHKYLSLANPHTKIIVLGPSTPLSPIMFDFGVDIFSGVLVEDEAALLDSIENGLSFRRMKGTRRVSLTNGKV